MWPSIPITWVIGLMITSTIHTSKVYMMPRNKAMSVPSAIEYNFATRNGEEI
jgi:hypothetical protein